MARARAVALVAALLTAIMGCSQPLPHRDDSDPPGWSRTPVPGCCTIALPPGVRLTPLADPVDDPDFKLEGEGFEGLLTLTSMGSGVPGAQSGRDYSARELTIDGRSAAVASYTITTKGNLTGRRDLLWTFAGANDGTGRNLILTLSCSTQACAKFDAIAGSLRRDPTLD